MPRFPLACKRTEATKRVAGAATAIKGPIDATLHVLFHGCFGVDPTRTRSIALSYFLSRDSSEDWAGAA